MTDYTVQLERKLKEIDAHIDRLKELYEAGDIDEKVRLLSELNQLRLMHDDLVERVETAKQEGSDQWSALHESFREEADSLHDTVAKWLTKLG